jgi:hypothetical protein
MVLFYGEAAPPYRFLAGLLLLGLPRRLIPGGLYDLATGGANDPLP